MKKTLFLAILVTLLAGCSGSIDWRIDIHETPQATETVFLTPTYTDIPTYTETPAESRTATPTAPPDTFTPTPTNTQHATATLLPPENILNNPGFEGSYSAYTGTDGIVYHTAQVASGWTPWWYPQQTDDPSWRNRMPEYKGANPYPDGTNPYPNRVLSGNNAQQFFTNWGTFFAGFYQQVEVEPGDVLRFWIWAMVWSTSYDDPDISENPGDVRVRVGIDPTGGVDPYSVTVVWGDDYHHDDIAQAGECLYPGQRGFNAVVSDGCRLRYDVYNWFTAEAVATAHVATVFVWVDLQYPVANTNLYFDDAVLYITQKDTTPTLTPTSTEPTPTPESSFWVEVAINALNVRAGESTTEDIAGVVFMGDQCLSTGDINSVGEPYLWLPVTCGEISGWVYTGVAGEPYVELVE